MSKIRKFMKGGDFMELEQKFIPSVLDPAAEAMVWEGGPVHPEDSIKPIEPGSMANSRHKEVVKPRSSQETLEAGH